MVVYSEYKLKRGLEANLPYLPEGVMGFCLDTKKLYIGHNDGNIELAKKIEVDNKVDKITGKGLSTNDYTAAEKTKLLGIENGARVNVIETVKVNGQALAISNKGVDISVPVAVSGTTSGTANSLTLSHEGFALFDGAYVRIKLHINIAYGATLNVNGTGAKPITYMNGSPIDLGNTQNGYMTLIYNGTNWILQGDGVGSRPHGTKIFTANGTFVVPELVKKVKIFLVGGGANGGVPDSQNRGGGAGGCSGHIAEGYLDVVSGMSIPITIGSHSATGGITSFGSYLSASGGSISSGGAGGGGCGTNGGSATFGGGGGGDGTCKGGDKGIRGGSGGNCEAFVSSDPSTGTVVYGGEGYAGVPINNLDGGTGTNTVGQDLLFTGQGLPGIGAYQALSFQKGNYQVAGGGGGGYGGNGGKGVVEFNSNWGNSQGAGGGGGYGADGGNGSAYASYDHSFSAGGGGGGYGGKGGDAVSLVDGGAGYRGAGYGAGGGGRKFCYNNYYQGGGGGGGYGTGPESINSTSGNDGICIITW